MPAILLLGIAAQLAHAAFPSWLIRNPYLEAAILAPPHVPFEPSFHAVLAPPADLGGMAGSAQPISFSVDDLGFRLTPGVDHDEAGVLVLEGLSYLWGASLADHETFPSALSRRLGIRAYNGGRYYGDPAGPDETDWLLERMPRVRYAILMILERVDLTPVGPRGMVTRTWTRLSLPPAALVRLRGRFLHLQKKGRYLAKTSPLLRAALPFDRTMRQTGLFYTPPEQASSVRRKLHGGRELSALTEDERRLLEPPGDAQVAATADAVAQMAAHLRSRGIGVGVVLVPDKLSAMAPLLREQPAYARTAGEYLDRLASALRARGLTVVNPLNDLHEASRGALQYHLHDTHWTAEGVKTVTEATVRELGSALHRSVGSEARPGHAVQ